MFMKTFIHILQNQFGVYVLRRSRYVLMGLDKSILSYEERYDIILDISQICNKKEQDDCLH